MNSQILCVFLWRKEVCWTGCDEYGDRTGRRVAIFFLFLSILLRIIVPVQRAENLFVKLPTPSDFRSLRNKRKIKKSTQQKRNNLMEYDETIDHFVCTVNGLHLFKLNQIKYKKKKEKNESIDWYFHSPNCVPCGTLDCRNNRGSDIEFLNMPGLNWFCVGLGGPGNPSGPVNEFCLVAVGELMERCRCAWYCWRWLG